MYIGVDIGGTKTLVAVLNEHGEIVEETRFETPKLYDNFLLELRNVAHHLEHHDFRAGGVGVTGVIDRQHGRRSSAGKLYWAGTVPIQADVEKVFGCPIVIENDAKLAGLSEAMLLKERFKRVLYLTVSTGVGFALIDNGVIDVSLGDRGGTTVMVEHRGKHVPWEDFASGRAIVERFGKRAVDIHDQESWKIIARNIASGLIELVALLEPQVVVVGGGVGSYFERFEKQLAAELKKFEVPAVTLPALRQAQRPEQAVIYGCYDLAKQTFGHD